MGAYDYSQNDSRWKDVYLGYSTHWYIGNHGGNNSVSGGCAVTSFAMMASALGHVVNPAEMNELMKRNDLINGAGDFTRNDVLSRLWPDIEYIESRDWPKDPAPMDYFNIRHDLNTEIIVKIDTQPAPGIQQHWLRVVGWDGKDDIIVVDPWDGKRKGISIYAARHRKSVGRIIFRAIKFRRKVAAPQPPAPSPVPTPSPPPPQPAPAPAPAPAPVPPPVAIPVPKPPAETPSASHPSDSGEGITPSPAGGPPIRKQEETAPPQKTPRSAIPAPGHKVGKQAKNTPFVRALKGGADFLVRLWRWMCRMRFGRR